MTTFRSEEGLVGLVALAVVPWIGWTLVRGLRAERLPIGRRHVDRRERPQAFRLLFAGYVAAVAVMIAIALDLLFGLSMKFFS
jgi:hypothetical protein